MTTKIDRVIKLFTGSRKKLLETGASKRKVERVDRSFRESLRLDLGVDDLGQLRNFLDEIDAKPKQDRAVEAAKKKRIKASQEEKLGNWPES